MNYALEPPREEHIWDFYHDLLLGFIDRQGHADVPRGHIEQGFALGIWVHKQRSQKDSLTPAQKASLEEIECWFWENETNPGLRPNPFVQTGPATSESAPSPPDAKIEHKPVPAETKPRRTIVSIDSKNRLVQRSSDGSVKKVVVDDDKKQEETDIWQSGYRTLNKYVNREGDCLVPANHIEADFNLGSWVVRQRLKRNIMSEQCRSLLESLDGWYWDKREGKWDKTFQLLEQFCEREGTAKVPANHIEEGVKLGSWVNSQKQYYRQNKLDSARKKKLESLPGWMWEKRDVNWENNFLLLQQYYDREDTTRVPGGHVEEGFSLGQWVFAQRRMYRNGKLKVERQHKLEQLPGWYWETKQMPSTNGEQKHAGKKEVVRSRHEIGSENSVDQDKWESRFQLLLQFGRREGHHRVPVRHVEDGVKLGAWVVNLRKKAEKLSPHQYNRLESLHGWSWNPHEEQWFHYYELLRKFVDREDHALVPKRHFEDGSNLGLWVMHQRDHYRRGELAISRVERLEKIRDWQWLGYGEILSDTDIDNLAQDVWTALFGLGDMTETTAAHTAVRKMNRTGIVRARLARPGSQIHTDVLKAFQRGIELGIIDRPVKGKIRAILADPEFYEDEDWDMCIEATLTDTPVKRNTAVKTAAQWAKSFLGLEFVCVKRGDKVYKELSEAIARATKKSSLVQLPGAMVGRAR